RRGPRRPGARRAPRPSTTRRRRGPPSRPGPRAPPPVSIAWHLPPFAPPPERQVVQQHHGGALLGHLLALAGALAQALELPLLALPREQRLAPAHDLVRQPGALAREPLLARPRLLLEGAEPPQLGASEAVERRRPRCARRIARRARAKSRSTPCTATPWRARARARSARAASRRRCPPRRSGSR